jgi:hypothetical protein
LVALSLGIARSAAAQAAPEQKMEEYRPIRWGFFAGGAAAFTVGFVPLCAGTRDERCIPIAGPCILVYQLWTDEGDPGSEDGIVPPRFVAIAAANLVLLQTAGAVFMTYAFLGPTKVRSVSGLRLSPMLSPELAGLTASGSF